MHHASKRLLVALTVTLCLVAGFAAPASSTTRDASVPVSYWGFGVYREYNYPNPGNPDNPTQVHPVPQNTWQWIQWDGCSQQVRVGYFNSYPYAEMRYVSGICDFGGVSLAMWQSFAGGQLYSKPTWNIPGSKSVCVVASPQAGSCVQTGSGSIWSQQAAVQAPYTLLGANAVICGKTRTGTPPTGNTNNCLVVNFGVF